MRHMTVWARIIRLFWKVLQLPTLVKISLTWPSRLVRKWERIEELWKTLDKTSLQFIPWFEQIQWRDGKGSLSIEVSQKRSMSLQRQNLITYLNFSLITSQQWVLRKYKVLLWILSSSCCVFLLKFCCVSRIMIFRSALDGSQIHWPFGTIVRLSMQLHMIWRVIRERELALFRWGSDLS